MNAKDIRKHELIGLKCEIVNASNASLVGCKGTIVDETRNTIMLDCEGQTKTILKEQATFNIKVDGQVVQVEGKDLVARPHDRLKK
ncbi:MAG: ribonuclease P protein subunit [archaeon]